MDTATTSAAPRRPAPPGRRAVLAALGTAAVVAAVALTAGRSVLPGPVARLLPGATDYLDDPAANAEAMAVADVVTHTMQDGDDATFGGVWVDSSGVVVAVVGGRPDPVLAQAVQTARRSAVPVHERAVRWSARHLDGLTARISADRTALAAAGATITVVGPDVERNVVRVSLETYSADAAEAVTSRYPGEPVEVERQSVGAVG